MKKRLIIPIALLFLGVFLFSLAVVSAAVSCSVTPRASCSGNVVMGVSDDSNAHGEFPDAATYNYVLCCDFGSGDTTCTGTNKIIGLSSSSNAHAEDPSLTNYGTDVCYEGVSGCYSTTGSCGATEAEILSLSSTTNAHIANFSGLESYSNRVCCQYSQCPTFTDNPSCLAYTSENCTWTPPWTNTNPDGGCCNYPKEWDGVQCIEGKNICNPIVSSVAVFWDPWNQLPGININPASVIYTQYCAKVTRDTSYGFWYDVNVY